eukprot:scaffold798_cov367-Pavlova_lutheri.AAC.19
MRHARWRSITRVIQGSNRFNLLFSTLHGHQNHKGDTHTFKPSEEDARRLARGWKVNHYAFRQRKNNVMRGREDSCKTYFIKKSFAQRLALVKDFVLVWPQRRQGQGAYKCALLLGLRGNVLRVIFEARNHLEAARFGPERNDMANGHACMQGSDSSMGLFVFPIRVMWGSTRMEDHLCFPLGFPDSHGYETGSIPFPSPFPPGSHVGVIGPHSTSPPCPTTVGVVAPRSLRHQRIQTNT